MKRYANVLSKPYNCVNIEPIVNILVRHITHQPNTDILYDEAGLKICY